MAWNAQGQWVADPVVDGQKSVTNQAASITGLLSPQTQATTTNSNVTTPQTAAPAVTTGEGAQQANAAAGTVGPNPNPPPSGFVMPDKPTLEDDSVVGRLNGLLDSNSPYMQAARMAGVRQANSRGLTNSSIAAGNSEAAAIAAAAPIASQEAQQIAARNQSAMDNWYQLRNSTTVQQLSDNAAWQRQAAQLTNALQLQGMSDTAAMTRLLAQGDIEKAIETMRESNALTQTQINANVSLIGSYMSAFAELSKNENLPADARNAYMAEFLRVTQQGQGLVNALSGVTVDWSKIPGASPPGSSPTTSQTGSYTGPSKDQIMAMQNDGQPGNFAQAAAAWNAAHPNDQISTKKKKTAGDTIAKGMFGAAGLLFG